MSLKKTFPPNKTPHHLIYRNRKFLPIDALLPDAWSEVLDLLQNVSRKSEVNFHVCVLMETHLHIIVTGSSIQLAADQIHSDLERLFNTKFELTKVAISHRKQFEITSKYIYRNPVQAKFAKKVEDYPFSTIRQLLGKQSSQLPVFDNLGLVTGGHKALNWLNGPISDFETQFLDSNSTN
jgi:hypothetical protein